MVLSCLPGCGPREPPNVVFLLIDTLRADRTSLHGHHRPTTPAMEALAATGVTFEHAYSPSSWTRASVASYFTGLYPTAHGCYLDQHVLDGAHLTLAERFRERGYVTVGIHANGNISRAWGFDQGFDLYHHPPRTAGYPDDYRITPAAEVNRRVLRWLREERPEKPWFLFLLYVDPHDPYLEHPEIPFVDARPSVDGSRRFLEELRDWRHGPARRQARRQIRGIYDEEIAYVDAAVGELLAVLDTQGLREDTVVILSADHGEGLWDHDDYRGHGGQVYEPQVHVPLVIRWPGRSRAGARISTPVAVLDVFGTLVEAHGLATEPPHQAGSLLPLLEGGSEARPVYIEQIRGRLAYRVLVDWPWKLIRRDHDGRVELYHLGNDPRERKPLRPGAHRRRLVEMTEHLTRMKAVSHGWYRSLELEGGEAVVDEELRDELRALGYVD